MSHRNQLQLPFAEFSGNRPPRIVNVASVPQRSVFRYPGGKTWLVPYIREWLRSYETSLSAFIEPFAGGGIAGLTVAFEGLADHVILVERDEQVAAVWKTILGEDAEWLGQRIVTFDFIPENVESELSRPATAEREIAFQTILKNRVNRGGILAPGAGRIKYGENGKGMRSRWYPETLRRRIHDISAFRNSITFVQGDAFDVIRYHAFQSDATFFVDPPYTAGGKRAGSRLYNYSEIDHDALFMLMSEVEGDFIMTYDDAPDVRRLASRFDFDVETVAMKSTHHAEMRELLISRDLTWYRKFSMT